MSIEGTTLPHNMRALRFNNFGTPAAALNKVRVALPSATPDESIVRVGAAGVNPSDIAMVGGLFGSELPGIPGRDFAGVAVSGPRAGEEVWGSGVGFGVSRPGADAEYVSIPTAWLSTKPANLSMSEAVAVTLSYCIAWWAVVTTGHIGPGQTLLIVGGSGNVAQAALNLALWQGTNVIVADQRRPSASVPYVSKQQQGFEFNVLQMTGSSGVDLVLDMVGGPLLGAALTTLHEAGHYLLVASPGGQDSTLDAEAFFCRRMRLTGLNMTAVSGLDVRAMLDEVRPGFESGALHAPPTRAWPMDEGAAAFEAVRAGSDGIKQVLLPGEDLVAQISRTSTQSRGPLS